MGKLRAVVAPELGGGLARPAGIGEKPDRKPAPCCSSSPKLHSGSAIWGLLDPHQDLEWNEVAAPWVP